MLRASYLLSDAGGEVGLVVRESLVSRQMTIRLDERAAGMPAELILFLAWIAVMIHRSDDGSPAKRRRSRPPSSSSAIPGS